MPECTIEIKDEVNVKIHDLDLVTRRQLEKKFKYFLPHAFHVPAYKLGRWDGCVSFFSCNNALPHVLQVDFNAVFILLINPI